MTPDDIRTAWTTLRQKLLLGEPRLYDGDTIDVLYPGETASAVLSPDVIEKAISDGETITITQWIVEPAPGFKMWAKRLRYRVFTQWPQQLKR